MTNDELLQLIASVPPIDELKFVPPELTKRELFAAMAMQGIMSNSHLQDEFKRNYNSEAAAIGPAKAGWNIERSIAYRATRVADALIELLGKGET